MSQWLLVRLARVLVEARQETLVRDGSSWDGGVNRALDKAIESIAVTLHQANMNIDPNTFALNAGYTGNRKL